MYISVILDSCSYKRNRKISTFKSVFSCLYWYYFGISYQNESMLYFENILSIKVKNPLVKHKVPNILNYIWVINPRASMHYYACDEIDLAIKFLDYDRAHFWSNITALTFYQGGYLCNNQLFIKTNSVYDLLMFRQYIQQLMLHLVFHSDYITITEYLKIAILFDFGGIILDYNHIFFNSPNLLHRLCDFMIGYNAYFIGGYIAAKEQHKIIQEAFYLMHQNLVSYIGDNALLNTRILSYKMFTDLFLRANLQISYYLYSDRHKCVDCIFPAIMIQNPWKIKFSLIVNANIFIISQLSWINTLNINYRKKGRFFYCIDSSRLLLHNYSINIKNYNISSSLSPCSRSNQYKRAQNMLLENFNWNKYYSKLLTCYFCIEHNHYNYSKYIMRSMPYTIFSVYENISVFKIPQIIQYIWFTDYHYPTAFPVRFCSIIDNNAIKLREYSINLWSNDIVNFHQNNFMCLPIFVNIRNVFNDLAISNQFLILLKSIELYSLNRNFVAAVELTRVLILESQGGISLSAGIVFFENPSFIHQIFDFYAGGHFEIGLISGSYVATKPHHPIVIGALHVLRDTSVMRYYIYHTLHCSDFVETLFQVSLTGAFFHNNTRDRNIDFLFNIMELKHGSSEGTKIVINNNTVIVPTLGKIRVNFAMGSNSICKDFYTEGWANIAKARDSKQPYIGVMPTVLRTSIYSNFLVNMIYYTIFNNTFFLALQFLHLTLTVKITDLYEDWCYKSDGRFYYYAENIIHHLYDIKYCSLNTKFSKEPLNSAVILIFQEKNNIKEHLITSYKLFVDTNIYGSHFLLEEISILESKVFFYQTFCDNESLGEYLLDHESIFPSLRLSLFNMMFDIRSSDLYHKEIDFITQDLLLNIQNPFQHISPIIEL